MTTNENGICTGEVAFATGAANGIRQVTTLAFAHEGVTVHDIGGSSADHPNSFCNF
jgi:NAD(P)-dependent dehydrogenase (short-subunit alcohol dehydrogenase family)